MPSEALDPQDAKLITLARGALARAEASSAAAVRDIDGRTYAAAEVELPSLRLSGLQAAVAAAVSSGAPGLEAAVIIGADATDPGVAAVTELGGPAAYVLIADVRAQVLDRIGGDR
ncbi:hypothetical protein GCM10027169_22800 [Gordonia jinhuaensis]|uniref:Cytidine deaminase n=1 Tax=Gordonia jinhuaensis TaxID=1517702 RepID=A0A916WZD7_9ACTN|nr:cytidine deaminase [Gordonia jinhuaensis]GGB41397.1 hypothetical protein GCM10011489_31250 [Gordonia jinhuaensis]